MISFNYPNIDLKDSDYTNIANIIKSGWVSVGKNVEECEEILINRFNVKYAVLCNNATSALTIALKAAGWYNKKISVPAFTWPSTIYSIESSCRNNKIKFSDIDNKTWLIDPDLDQCDAIVSVDTFGNNSDLSKITNVPVIYDAAHGFDLHNLGHRGIAEVVSFSFTKIVTAGEGGVILTNDSNLAQIAKELRRLSSRMTEVNATILKNSIKRYDSFFKNFRYEIIENYRKGFDFEFTEQLIPIDTNYSVYSILFPTTSIRNIVCSSLFQNNIEHKTYYEPLVLGLTNTDDVFSRILSLPIHEKMKHEQNLIINIINKAVASGSTPGKVYLNHDGYLKKYLQMEI